MQSVFTIKRVRRGLTLVELIVVLTIMATLATLVMRNVGPLLLQDRYDETWDVLQEIKRSVLDVNFDNSRQTYVVHGFVADMGRLPEVAIENGSSDDGTVNWTSMTLLELLERPDGSARFAGRVAMPYEVWSLPTSATAAQNQRTISVNNTSRRVKIFDNRTFGHKDVSLGAGWNGPYLAGPAGYNELYDSWGNRLETNNAAASSGYKTSALLGDMPRSPNAQTRIAEFNPTNPNLNAPKIYAVRSPGANGLVNNTDGGLDKDREVVLLKNNTLTIQFSALNYGTTAPTRNIKVVMFRPNGSFTGTRSTGMNAKPTDSIILTNDFLIWRPPSTPVALTISNVYKTASQTWVLQENGTDRLNRPLLRPGLYAFRVYEQGNYNTTTTRSAVHYQYITPGQNTVALTLR